MIKRVAPVLAFTVVCWLVFLANNSIGHGELLRYGIVPRQFNSLAGILWAPFLHSSLRHIAANSLPLLILGAIICGRGKGEFAVVTAAGIIVGGSLTWLCGRNAVHVGASGLIFCYFGYLASLAWFNRNLSTIVLSVACIVGYGGMIRGILPT